MEVIKHSITTYRIGSCGITTARLVSLVRSIFFLPCFVEANVVMLIRHIHFHIFVICKIIILLDKYVV